MSEKGRSDQNGRFTPPETSCSMHSDSAALGVRSSSQASEIILSVPDEVRSSLAEGSCSLSDGQQHLGQVPYLEQLTRHCSG